jgi:AcrR family transcriptional regulator
MNEKRKDRRVRKTRQALRDAMLALILEKGYDAVTIEEITDRADLGRTTFYLHYKDKEDLLLESISELVDDLVKQISEIPLSAWRLGSDGEGPKPAMPILLTFQHAAANADLYRIILRGGGALKTTERLRKIINQTVNEFLQVKTGKERLVLHAQIPLDVFSNYLAGSWLGIITWWLEQDMPYPPDQMADMFQKMFMLGAREVLGVVPV